MTRCNSAAVVLVAASLFHYPAFADDDAPPLYVATDGEDIGSCQSAAAPCRTIDYALERVGKNGRIRVAGGSYELAASENVVYMLSGAIDVRGGFRKVDDEFASAGATTTLVGAPVAYADELARRGFRVIADSKSISEASVTKMQALVEAQASLQSNTTATPCVNGAAGAFACNNVDLLAHIAERTVDARGSDIWGFMDLNTHREYAIVGYSIGTAVYDISDPENPREVGFVDGQRTTWRDIKVHQFWNTADNRWNALAYVTADNASDGLFIIDLSELPQRVSRIDYTSDIGATHNVYLTGTDFSTGLALSGSVPTLILAGPDRSDGRFRSYDLSNPASPAFIAAPQTPAGQPENDRLYMHDAASMAVTDSRKDSQCVNAGAAAHCDVLFDFNESSIDIWDVSIPSDPVRLSRTAYDNAGYVHSGWWSEDGQYLFVQDETDERDRALPTTLRVFSISDLTAPTLAGTWSGPTTAIDHNGFVRGNRYYMSNYARGLTILDITSPASPATAGRFDTYPASDAVGFPGAWGTYPFLPSGIVLISDIDSGLYVVADKTLNVAQGSLAFSSASFGMEETQTGSVRVRRDGGAAGAIAVQWELVAATATMSDVSAYGGTLSWGPGDTSDRVIDIVAADDGTLEGLERLLIRLRAPTGGATLSSPSVASLYISDAGNPGEVAFAEPSVSVAERGFATAVVVVRRTGSAVGAASVKFDVGGGDASAGQDYSGPASGTLTWTDGDADPKWIEFAIADDGSGEADEFFTVTLSNATGANLGTSRQLRVDILDALGVNDAPNAVAGASQSAAPGDNVVLNGGQSNDPDSDSLSYAWNQTIGPTVALRDANTVTASFTAPNVGSDTLLRFQLQVSDPGGLSDTGTTSVTIIADGADSSGAGGGGPVSIVLLVMLGFAAAWRLTTRRGAT